MTDAVEVVVGPPITIEVVDQGAAVETVTGAIVAVEIVGVGPQGPAGAAGATYTHTQTVAASIWTINHNLGVYPAITLFTVGGSEFDAEITHTSANQAVVALLAAQAGFARCN